MTRAFVSMGSNIDPETNIGQAVLLLNRETQVINISTVYLTEPEGGPGQASYYNCVIEIETDLPPAELKQKVLRGIEARLGRVRTEDKYAARTVDLDLILYDDLAMTSDVLTLPDPDILRRSFLAVPLLELEPGLTLPGIGLRISDITARLKGTIMKPLAEYTKQLREDIHHDRKQGTRREIDKRTAG